MCEEVKQDEGSAAGTVRCEPDHACTTRNTACIESVEKQEEQGNEAMLKKIGEASGAGAMHAERSSSEACQFVQGVRGSAPKPPRPSILCIPDRGRQVKNQLARRAAFGGSVGREG